MGNWVWSTDMCRMKFALGVVHRHVQNEVCTGCGGRRFGFHPESSLLGILYRLLCVCRSNYYRATSNHIGEVLEKR